MRSSRTRGRALWAFSLALALLLTGCIASEGPTSSLSAAEGSGDLVIYVTLEDGQLIDREAWWAHNAPDLTVGLENTADAWEALVLKNDVVLSREPLQGTASRAVFTWHSSDAGAIAQAGDVFEVLVVNATGDETVGSFVLEIDP